MILEDFTRFHNILEDYPSFYKTQQGSARFYIIMLFLRFLKFKRFCIILQGFESFCKVLQDSTRFWKILQDFADFVRFQKSLYDPIIPSQCAPGIFNLDQKFHGFSCFWCFHICKRVQTKSKETSVIGLPK